VPGSLARHELALAEEGHALAYTYDANVPGEDQAGIAELLADLEAAGIGFKDLHTRQSSLEEIFVSLVKETA